MASYTWDVVVPDADVMRQVTTDYIVSAGEEIVVEGKRWLVTSVQVVDEIPGAAGIVTVELGAS
jgi:hypothetical protein